MTVQATNYDGTETYNLVQDTDLAAKYGKIKKVRSGVKNHVFNNLSYGTLFSGGELDELFGETVTQTNVHAVLENIDVSFNHTILGTYSSSTRSLGMSLGQPANGTMKIRYILFLTEE